jgi:polysaccharide chain length determinant protein (PEP-CTERM system associated)
LVRNRWIILMPLAIGAAAAPYLARYAPARYRSEALILVVPQQVPDNYVKPTVSETVEQRLPSITGQILSRSRLERIIQEMNLYSAERARQVMEDVVQRMRSDVSTTADGKDVNSFRVSFVSDNAETARKVTERLASLYIDQNLKDRETQAESTSQFLTTQLEEAKQRLIAQEKKLEEYRRTHAGQMPSQLAGNLQAIQNANTQLQALNESTNRAQERRLLIERQIADAEAVPSGSTLAASSTTNRLVALSTAQQLEIARAQLAASLQQFTPSHPEVVAMQRTVDELTARLQEERQKRGSDGDAPKLPDMPGNSTEATQRKRVLDLQAELAVIDHQLAANHADEAQLKKTIATYQVKVDVVPTRESELVELTRDYSTLQSGYSNLLTKREDAVIAANLERRQIGEQFKLLDAASMPEKPYNQSQRMEVMASGSGAGLVLGLLIVALREFRDSTFTFEEEATSLLQLPVLALIPNMISESERRSARRRARALDAIGTLALFIAAAVLAMWRFRS